MVDTPTSTTATDTGPLDWRIGITDKSGRPTPEFQRRWNTQRNNNGLIGATIGHGAPTGTPASDGLIYIDEDTDPGTEYVSIDSAWVRVSVVKFKELQDVPQSYVGHAGNPLRVNSTEDGIEYTTVSGLLDEINNTRGDILYRGASGWVALGPGTSGNFLKTNGTGADPAWAAVTGTGTVTSVALTAPAIFTVGGSPITTSGTLAITLATQSPNLIFAGPVSGAAAAPTFRGIVAADLPLATTGAFGVVKPDGTSITISAGVISSVGSGGGGQVTYFGTGAPSTTHNSGDFYFDTTTSPYVGYVQRNIPAAGAVPVVDGTATGQWSGTTAGSASLTTSSANDVIVAVVMWEVNTTTMPTLTSVTASGLTFTKRSGILNPGTGTPMAAMEVWWAPAASAITGRTITATLSGNCDDAVIAVFGVSGATNYLSPWDANVSLPSTGVNTAAPVSLAYNTTSGDDLIIHAEGGNGGGLSNVPTGYTNITSIQNSGGALFAGVRVAGLGAISPVTGGSVAGGSTVGGLRVGMVDAITGAGATTPTWVLIAPGYSTGTWTPTDASGAGLTFTSTLNEYVQIGSQVIVSSIITYPTTASTATAAISGLPFPVAGGPPTNVFTISSLTNQLFSLPFAGTSSTRLFYTGSAFAQATNAQLSGAQIFLSVIYNK